jgi:hypothetical protein
MLQAGLNTATSLSRQR